MDNKIPSWKIVNDEPIENFRIFSAKKSTRINPRTGAQHTFFLMDGLDWVNIIALTPENEVILVRQFRHGGNEEFLELPGGCVELNEDPALSARRELEEETGYKISKIESLGCLHANPAMQSMKVHYFVGYNAVLSGKIQLDEAEDIISLKMPVQDFFKAVQGGKITHALMVAAAGLFALKYPSFLQGQ